MEVNNNTVIALVIAGFMLLLGSWVTQKENARLRDVTAAEITLLAQLIDAEARGEPYRGQVAVGAVVVNRVKHNAFPNTIADVIYDSNQFYAAGIPDHDPPSGSAVRAATAAVNGEDPTRGALYFYNPDIAVLSPWWDSRRKLVKIGNHQFLR